MTISSEVRKNIPQPGEIFKQFRNTFYTVSNQGRVYNTKSNSFLTPRDLRGYKRVALSIDGKSHDFRIHRMVGECFIPNPEDKPQINHKNGIRNDNRLSNLENMRHRNKTFGSPLRQGINNGNNSLSEEDILFIRSSNLSVLELGGLFNVNRNHIYRIINKKAWGHV